MDARNDFSSRLLMVVARKTIVYVNFTASYSDTREALMMLPSNRFKALGGTRQSQYCIRINNQWRICFEWGYAGPENVEIVDYH